MAEENGKKTALLKQVGLTGLGVIVGILLNAFSGGLSAGEYKNKVDQAEKNITELHSMTIELGRIAATNAAIIANHEKILADINERLRDHEIEDRGKFKALQRSQ